MKHILLIHVLLLIRIPSAIPAQSQASSFDTAIDGIIFGGLPFKGLVTLADFQQRLGKPVSVTTKQVENPHNSDKDAIHKLVYRGLVLDLYEITRDHNIAILDVEVSDNRWRLPAKIRIGSTREEVSRLLGKATKELNSEWEYICSDCVYENTITFKFSGEKVVTMKWKFALD